jgi:hypothetical protein
VHHCAAEDVVFRDIFNASCQSHENASLSDDRWREAAQVEKGRNYCKV